LAAAEEAVTLELVPSTELDDDESCLAIELHVDPRMV
jgi:hypothetical protein